MSWYNASWKYRAPLAIDNTAGGAGSADATCALPADWDFFWSTINQTDGRDLRVCDSDGITLLTYDLNGFNLANRALTVEIDNYTLVASATRQVWIYWGNSGAAAANSVFAPAAPKTAYALVAAPGARLVRVGPQRPGETKPRNVVTKASAEQVYLYFDFSPVLHRRVEQYSSDKGYEELADVTSVDVQTGGASQAAMFDATTTRFLDGGIVRMLVKAGTSGTDYTAICRCTTSYGQTIEGRALIKVRNVAE